MKLLLLILCCFTCIYSSAQIQAANDINNQKLSQIQRKLNQNKSKLAPKKEQKKKTLYKIGKLNREIKYNEHKLKETKKKYAQAIKKERQTKVELKSMQKENKQIKSNLSQRIVQIHKESPFSIIEMVISKKDFIFDANHLYFFNKIIKNDTDLINNLNNKEKNLFKKKKRLENETTTIKALKQQIESREKKLSQQKSKQSAYLSQIENEINTILKQNKDLERLSNEFSELIRNASLSKTFLGTGNFIRPVKGWISSKYGMRKHPIFKRRIKHTGIDIAAPKGRRIVAADSGKVIFAGTKGGYGKSVLIYHGVNPATGKSLSTFYAHQSRILVKKDEIVKKGDEIGWVGATGYATGPHLHFEMKEDGKHIDPLIYLKH